MYSLMNKDIILSVWKILLCMNAHDDVFSVPELNI